MTKITGDELGEINTPIKDLQKAAFDYALKGFRDNQIINTDTGWNIQIPTTGIKKTMSHAAKREHVQSIVALPELLKEGVKVSTEPNRNDKAREYIPFVHTFFAPIQIGNNIYRARLIVKESKDGHKFYDHDLTKIENHTGGALPDAGATPAKSVDLHAEHLLPKQGADSQKSSGSIDNIANSSAGFNDKSGDSDST